MAWPLWLVWCICWQASIVFLAMWSSGSCDSRVLSITHILKPTKYFTMAKMRGAIVVDKEACKGCGVCITACPTNVLALSKELNAKGYPTSYMKNPEACTGCTNCAMVCPDVVITVYRKRVS